MGARFDRLRCEVFQNLFLSPMNTGFVRPAVATVLTACGIETSVNYSIAKLFAAVATVLTACGIETFTNPRQSINSLPLQQYLPLAVLKPAIQHASMRKEDCCSCNSTYRLRYATKGARQQRSEETMRTAHL